LREQTEYFMTCLSIFTLQTLLIALIFYEFNKNELTTVEGFFSTPPISVVIARFICAILLHFSLYSEILQSHSMLRYLNNHPEEFDYIL